MAQWTVWLRNEKKERVGIWGNKEGTHYTFTRSRRWPVVHLTHEINSRTLHYEFVRHWANKTGQTCMARWEVVLVVFLFLRWNVISSYTPRAETGVWCVLDSRLLLMIRKLQHATQNEREVEENTKRKNRDFFPSFYEFYSSSPEQSVCCFVWASADSLFPYHHHHLTDSFREIVKK